MIRVNALHKSPGPEDAQLLTSHSCLEEQQILKAAFRRIEELEAEVSALKAEKESYDMEKCLELLREAEIPEESSPYDEQEATGNSVIRSADSSLLDLQWFSQQMEIPMWPLER